LLIGLNKMVQKPLVSILIPCYNVSEFVERAVLSILNQTYNNLEVWIIDDASTDNTLSILNNFKDKRLNLIAFKENTHKVGAVNSVLKKVKGEFISFQDADDWSEPDRIAEQVNQFLLNPNLGICFTGYKYFGISNRFPNQFALSDQELKNEFLNFWKNRVDVISPTICATMMITREVLKTTGGYHEYFKGRIAEDIHWIYRILKQNQGITVNKPLYHYNIREGSFTQQQLVGKNAKHAYAWHLLSKIIHKDVYENTDLLSLENREELLKIELLACEEALTESLVASRVLREKYEKSMSYRIGKFLLKPLHFLKQIKNSGR
jgi:glycosyltransferase involved in cell wall biosynthesis